MRYFALILHGRVQQIFAAEQQPQLPNNTTGGAMEVVEVDATVEVGALYVRAEGAFVPPEPVEPLDEPEIAQQPTLNDVLFSQQLLAQQLTDVELYLLEGGVLG